MTLMEYKREKTEIERTQIKSLFLRGKKEKDSVETMSKANYDVL